MQLFHGGDNSLNRKGQNYTILEFLSGSPFKKYSRLVEKNLKCL